MTTEQSTKLMDELLEVTHGLVEAHPIPDGGTQFLRLVEGAFRKNYVRLQSVALLCSQPMTANNALELVRNMVEDVICIEYMMIKGKEQAAQTFAKHKWVQLHDDMTYATSLGIEIEESEDQATHDDIETHYQALPSRLKGRRNWAGISVEEMLQVIADNQVLSERELSVIGRLYIEGNRKTHFNPYDILHWMQQETIESGSDRALLMATIFAVTSMIRMTTRYIDEINEIADTPQYIEVATAAKAILDKYPTKENA